MPHAAEHAGHPGKKERTVGGNQRKFEPVATARQIQLNRVFAQVIGHFHLTENVACGLRAQIAPRQSVEKTFEFLASRRRERAQMRQGLPHPRRRAASRPRYAGNSSRRRYKAARYFRPSTE